jgi:hypothetical protein
MQLCNIRMHNPTHNILTAEHTCQTQSVHTNGWTKVGRGCIYFTSKQGRTHNVPKDDDDVDKPKHEAGGG